MVINQYRKTLLYLFGELQSLKIAPYEHADKFLEIQEILMRRIFALESRIRKLRSGIKESKAFLANEGRIRQDKVLSMSLKKKISRFERTIEECQQVQYILRSVGDGLVFLVLPRYDMRLTSSKQSAGSLSGKAGFTGEKYALRFISRQRDIAILNDLTNSLRHGDLTVLHNGKVTIIELKIGIAKGDRIERQRANLEKLERYLQTHDGYPGFNETDYSVRRKSVHALEQDHIEDLNWMIDRALDKGMVAGEVEKGLHYCMAVESNVMRFPSFIGNLGSNILPFYLNQHKYSGFGYLPSTLTLSDPNALFSFFAGDLSILEILNIDVFKEKFAQRGLAVEFLNDPEWGLSVRYLDPTLDSHFGPTIISRHFFGRLFFEFLRLDWFVEELISGHVHLTSLPVGK